MLNIAISITKQIAFQKGGSDVTSHQQCLRVPLPPTHGAWHLSLSLIWVSKAVLGRASVVDLVPRSPPQPEGWDRAGFRSPSPWDLACVRFPLNAIDSFPAAFPRAAIGRRAPVASLAHVARTSHCELSTCTPPCPEVTRIFGFPSGWPVPVALGYDAEALRGPFGARVLHCDPTRPLFGVEGSQL